MYCGMHAVRVANAISGDATFGLLALPIWLVTSPKDGERTYLDKQTKGKTQLGSNYEKAMFHRM